MAVGKGSMDRAAKVTANVKTVEKRKEIALEKPTAEKLKAKATAKPVAAKSKAANEGFVMVGEEMPVYYF